MDLIKSGKMLCDLRKAKGLTQKDVADRIGITAKAVSKWETGNGFPDVALLGQLAQILGVSEKILLAGEMTKNKNDAGNMKRLKFYVCPDCGSIVTALGNSEISCCGKRLEALKAKKADKVHGALVEDVDNEYYITFSHPMEKEHYISFVSYVRFDRVMTVKLYPEQSGEVRMPYMRGGRMYLYCNKDGLYEVK